MDRKNYLLKYIDRSKLGIEVGSYIHLTVSKKEVFNVKIPNVFTANDLINRSENCTL